MQCVIPAALGLIAVKPSVFVIASVIVLHVAQLLEVLQEGEVGGIVVSQLLDAVPSNIEPVVLGPGQVKWAVEEHTIEEMRNQSR